jgi:diacylglycerol kinase (ATP)
VRVLACGGDGTMGWILSAIDKVWAEVLGAKFQLERSRFKGHLPLAMMPLGTGNDLARQFNWGKSYDESMRSPKMVARVASAAVRPLDRWRCVVVPDASLDEETRAWVPAMLGEKMRDREASIANIKEVFREEDMMGGGEGEEEEEVGRNSIQVAGEIAETQSFDGVFCNYFSVGIDARVAFSFHKEREAHPERFKSVVGNKIKYIQKVRARVRAKRTRRGV